VFIWKVTKILIGERYDHRCDRVGLPTHDLGLSRLKNKQTALRVHRGLQMVNRLLYRSKQRGLLELDLLIGEYAELHLPSMDAQQLEQAEAILGEENPDLWKWLTLQTDAPEHLIQNRVFKVCNRNNPFKSYRIQLVIAKPQRACG
jgi:succinate dehydrogenase flavin-adding protein (antitoxin of CptAB toxin-antitoxin module)